MNPISNTAQKVGLPKVRDKPQPQFAAQDVAAENPPATVKPELIQDIPVRNPIAGNPSAVTQVAPDNPISQAKPTTDPAKDDDKDLDRILKDVNSSVKKSDDSTDEQFERSDGTQKKVPAKKAKVGQKHASSPPIAATVVACTVAVMLVISAMVVYKSG